MRVIVTGGRYFLDRDSVFAELDALLATYHQVFVIHGACCERGEPLVLRGADRWAEEWAKEREQPYLGVPAQWQRFSNKAGPLRNLTTTQMEPDLVLAFPGGTGTKNMVDTAEAFGIAVKHVPERQA